MSVAHREEGDARLADSDRGPAGVADVTATRGALSKTATALAQNGTPGLLVGFQLAEEGHQAAHQFRSLDADLARAEPKTLRYRILRAAARLTRSGRGAT